MKKPAKKQQPLNPSAVSDSVAPLVAPAAVQVQVPLVYADAIGNLLMSPINSRLTLVLNAGQGKDGVQPTVTTMEVVLPTPALLQFGKKLRELMRERGPQLAKAYEEAGKQIMELSEPEAK